MVLGPFLARGPRACRRLPKVPLITSLELNIAHADIALQSSGIEAIPAFEKDFSLARLEACVVVVADLW